MARQTILHSSSMNRRQPLLTNQSPGRSMRFAEVAGGTAAECAAICCCCPCGLMNLLVLAVYKLPAGLCRRALNKKRRQRLKKKGLLPHRHGCTCGCDESHETELQIHPVSSDDIWPIDKSENLDSLSAKEALELEKEMWDRFYSTGFWRSPSQRE